MKLVTGTEAMAWRLRDLQRAEDRTSAGKWIRRRRGFLSGNGSKREIAKRFSPSRTSGGEMNAGSPESLVVGSYNVHRCVGRDGQCDPERTAVVINELGARVVALQGVESRAHIDSGVDQFELLGHLARLDTIAGPILCDDRGHYGNALLTDLPTRRIRRVDLSVPGREPRGALDAELEGSEGPLRVLTTHLGMGWRERRIQIRRILELLSMEAATPVVLLGDMNAWLPLAHGLAPLDRYLGSSAKVPTFPSWLPLFSLNRIWTRPVGILGSLRTHRSRVARLASRRLPVRAELQYPSR
jgi:endonuclease/exonuclease/phosphatase family metal-dependent hydrolase